MIIIKHRLTTNKVINGYVDFGNKEEKIKEKCITKMGTIFNFSFAIYCKKKK